MQVQEVEDTLLHPRFSHMAITKEADYRGQGSKEVGCRVSRPGFLTNLPTVRKDTGESFPTFLEWPHTLPDLQPMPLESHPSLPDTQQQEEQFHSNRPRGILIPLTFNNLNRLTTAESYRTGRGTPNAAAATCTDIGTEIISANLMILRERWPNCN